MSSRLRPLRALGLLGGALGIAALCMGARSQTAAAAEAVSPARSAAHAARAAVAQGPPAVDRVVVQHPVVEPVVERRPDRPDRRPGAVPPQGGRDAPPAAVHPQGGWHRPSGGDAGDASGSNPRVAQADPQADPPPAQQQTSQQAAADPPAGLPPPDPSVTGSPVEHPIEVGPARAPARAPDGNPALAQAASGDGRPAPPLEGRGKTWPPGPVLPNRPSPPSERPPDTGHAAPLAGGGLPTGPLPAPGGGPPAAVVTAAPSSLQLQRPVGVTGLLTELSADLALPALPVHRWVELQARAHAPPIERPG